MRSGLLALEGDPDSARGGVTSRVMADVFRSFLPDLLEPGDIFMMDNAPVHTARAVSALLREMGVTTMDWPPCSPDLDPIENLWAILKAEIYKLHPELQFADDTVETLSQLKEAAREAWNMIDDSILYNIATSMERRVKAVRLAQWMVYKILKQHVNINKI